MRISVALLLLVAAFAAPAGIRLSGSESGINMPGNASTGCTNVTVAGWFRFASVPMDSFVLLQFSPFQWPLDYLAIQTWEGKPYGRVTSSYGSPSGENALASSALATNVWYHLAASLSPSAITLYVNGAQAASTSISLAWSSVGGPGTNTLISIGAYYYTGYRYYIPTCDVAEVAVWDRTLSAGEIKGLATGQYPPMLPKNLLFYDPMVTTNGWNHVRAPRTTWTNAIPPLTNHPKTFKP